MRQFWPHFEKIGNKPVVLPQIHLAEARRSMVFVSMNV